MRKSFGITKYTYAHIYIYIYIYIAYIYIYIHTYRPSTCCTMSQGLVSQGQLVSTCETLRAFLELPPKGNAPTADSRSGNGVATRINGAGQMGKSTHGRESQRVSFRERNKERSIDSDSDVLNL